MNAMAVSITGDAAADALLERDPLALVFGMVLDQQVPIEKAFSGPHVLAERLGVDHLDVARIAALDAEEFVEVASRPPAIHRYPRSMAQRLQALARHVVEHHGGDVSAVWRESPDGATTLARLKALPGFGDAKARIFLALLAKQFGVCPPGWEEAAGDYGVPGSHRSVADVVDAASLRQVREYKRAMKVGR